MPIRTTSILSVSVMPAMMPRKKLGRYSSALNIARGATAKNECSRRRTCCRTGSARRPLRRQCRRQHRNGQLLQHLRTILSVVHSDRQLVCKCRCGELPQVLCSCLRCTNALQLLCSCWAQWPSCSQKWPIDEKERLGNQEKGSKYLNETRIMAKS
jgi:hypothetical protein